VKALICSYLLKERSAKQECVGMQDDKKQETDNIGRSEDKTSVGRFSPAG